MAMPKPKPKVITHKETKSRPAWEFSKGMNTYMRISTEIEGSRNAIQGWCEHAPDFEPMVWDQANWDELFFCHKGSLKVLARDKHGAEKELVAQEGDSMFLPAGFHYTLLATGEQSVNYWTVTPVPSTGIKALKDLGFDVVGLSDELKAIGKAKG